MGFFAVRGRGVPAGENPMFEKGVDDHLKGLGPGWGMPVPDR